jgi:hypothetical protein
MPAATNDPPEHASHRLGAAVMFAIGGAISATLALAVWALGYFESQPIGWGPNTSSDATAGPHPYVILVAVWAAAAVAELIAAAVCGRRPRMAVVVVVAAIAAGFAATLAAAPAVGNLLPVSVATLAWLAPALPLLVGIASALRAIPAGRPE